MPLPKSFLSSRWVGRCVAALILIPVLWVVGMVMSSGGAAPVPAAFDPGVTLAQATAAAKAAKQPVLVFATADWCGPCQMLKREGLADDRVTSWVKANTQPVYLDVDKARDAALELGVMSIPVLILLREDKIVDRLEGVHDADAVLAWLQQAR